VSAPEERSAPAQNPRPAPVTMMALTLSSLSAASKASINSFCMAALKALSLSGRFSVMVRICSATSYLIVSYAIGVSSLLLF
jgi:hypothetical protein